MSCHGNASQLVSSGLALLIALVAQPSIAQSTDDQRMLRLDDDLPTLIDHPPILTWLPPVSPNLDPPIPPHVRSPLTQTVRDIAAANNRFGFDLFSRLREKHSEADNALISPLSISTALAMTYAGARGENAAQIGRVLHLDDLGDNVYAGFGSLITDLNAPRPGYELSVANRLFGQEQFPFRQSFLDRLANDYQAPLERLDFRRAPEPSRTHINDWVADQTHDRIKDLLPSGSIVPETSLVLTNAVYFNGKWKHGFDEEATHDAPFYVAKDSIADAPTMFQRNTFKYGQFADFQMLEMPYAGDDLSMVVMLPSSRDGLRSLETSLTAERFDESLQSLQNREVDVFLPKFTFKDSAKLKAPLTTLGMTDAFGGGDFSGIADIGLQIDEVYHKTFIDVNENGTEAAAATAVVVVTTTAVLNPPPPPVFRADHPFLFALRDTHTGSLLFLGRMADPGAATASAHVPEPATATLTIAGLMALATGRRRTRPRR
jgi:serpin B